MARNGTFTARFRVMTGIIGDGYCGTPGHATCVIGVGDVQGQGTVVRITFKVPAPADAGHHDDQLTRRRAQASCSHSRWLYPMIRPRPTPTVSFKK